MPCTLDIGSSWEHNCKTRSVTYASLVFRAVLRTNWHIKAESSCLASGNLPDGGGRKPYMKWSYCRPVACGRAHIKGSMSDTSRTVINMTRQLKRFDLYDEGVGECNCFEPAFRNSTQECPRFNQQPLNVAWKYIFKNSWPLSGRRDEEKSLDMSMETRLFSLGVAQKTRHFRHDEAVERFKFQFNLTSNHAIFCVVGMSIIS